MAVVDPAIITGAGALLSTIAGGLLERRRLRAKREEPEAIESSAVEAVKEIAEPPPATVGAVHGHRDAVLVSEEEVEAAVRKAVGKLLKEQDHNTRKWTVLLNIAFFVATILATVTIALLVHPIGKG